jgi:hypothetical protein
MKQARQEAERDTVWTLFKAEGECGAIVFKAPPTFGEPCHWPLSMSPIVFFWNGIGTSLLHQNVIQN